MAISIKHNGVYRFKNYAYQTNTSSGNTIVLNAYGTSNLASGRNVMLYELSTSDNAQKWRAMYAGKNGNDKLYWLNCELGGRGYPYALDRFMGSNLTNNADVYKAVDSSAADQIVYFREQGSTGRVFIRLYANGYALTAAPNSSGVNGNNAPTSLTQAGNVYWAPYTGSTAQQWVVTTVLSGADPTTSNKATEFPADAFYNSANNGSYPTYVGECTWYCRGRFYEEHGIKNCGSGDAYAWASCALPSGVARDTTNKTPRAQSVAVFGKNNVSTAGHVIFIEDVTSTSVIWSDCNGTTVNSTFKISNGEIEVRNSSLSNARDGYKTTTDKDEFSTLFGSGLTAIIYKK